MKTDKTPLTLGESYNMQLTDISEWAKILNTDAYLILLGKVIERNKKGYLTPYEVVRGSSLDNIVKNIKL